MLIYTVCGAGIGTSVLLKANVDKVLSRLDVEAEVRAVTVDSVLNGPVDAQVVIATEEVASQLESIAREVIVVFNIFDLAELEEKLFVSVG
ncbi:MAG: PTS sugar transporter subunit IIB [Aquiluna sp.]